MVEQWLEAHIFFRNNQEGNVPLVLQEVVRYCADDLESKNMRKTFHYLLEPRIDGKPGFEILFRIEVRENTNLDEIEKIVIKRIDQFLHLVDGKRITKGYHGEAEGFGQDGWELTKQLFEIGSKIAIGQLSESFRKGEKFSPGKLVHCFLNQQMINEEMFHADKLVGRVLITLGVSSVTREVENRAKGLLEEALNKFRSSQIRML
jgi:hypothetical protein